ncbi:hypothetical protein [Microlunatus endophyticus]|nr:hypothetical protein [Microlunatus endophyticus]
MTDAHIPRSPEEGRSLDRVQRVLASVIITIVLGIHSAAVGLYAVFNRTTIARSDAIGLCTLTGVIGLISTAIILKVNRRRLSNPLVLLGLVPMAICSYLTFH